VQVATQHAEAVRECTGIGVEKRLLLDGITLRPGDISPRRIERAASVVSHLADSCLPLRYGTAVATGVTADPAAVEFFVEPRVGFADSIVEDVAQGKHRL
jgi:hypothetical protein